MKNIISKSIIVALMLTTFNIYAQENSLNNFYHGFDVSINKTVNKGYWEIDAGASAGDKITYSDNSNGTALDVFLGYEKAYSNYFMAIEFGLELALNESANKKQNNDWEIAFQRNIEMFISATLGKSLSNKNDIYVQIHFIPYSKHIIEASHLDEGGWEDHNFPGYGAGVGYRYKLSKATALRSAVFYKQYNLNQPAKDNAISNEDVAETGLSFGVMSYF